MEKKLIEVAKELNVGKDTIVEYLTEKGYQIDNRPIAKVSQEMYDIVAKKFHDSLAEKQKADSLAFGTRPANTGNHGGINAPKTPSSLPPLPTNRPSLLNPTSNTPEVIERPKPAGLNVLGRLDLSGKSPVVEPVKAVPKVEAKVEPKIEPTVAPTPTVVAPPVEQKPTVHVPTETAKPADTTTPPVVGKISLTPPVAKTVAPPPAPTTAPTAPTPPTATPSNNNNRSQTPPQQGQGQNNRNDRDRGGDRNNRDRDRNRGDRNRNDAPRDVSNMSLRQKLEAQRPNQNTPPPAPPVAPPTEDTTVNKTVAPEFLKTEAPQLKGLNIQGKIDLGQFDRPKPTGGNNRDRDRNRGGRDRNRPATTATGGTGTTTTPNTTTGGAAGAGGADKRKRKRKKAPGANPSVGDAIKQAGNSGTGNNTQQGTGGQNRSQQSSGGGQNRSNQPQQGNNSQQNNANSAEISKKDIDEKIKATMARLNVGGKSRGQKNRRDKREKFRDREEQRQLDLEGGKLQVAEFVSVSELASLMDVSVGQVITTCMNLGIMVSINQRLDAEVIEVVAGEFGHEVEFISAEEQVTDDVVEDIDAPEDLLPRAPIVTVMGHVDHGKTSLLDFIRSANVASGEAGGITQHIGAYEVVTKEGQKITFLDTPGHEAFTAMRARGAKVTDVAVIIVAADDNIMPQTKEAISHSQAAGVPMVFAINKIDKAGSDPERIKSELANMNLLVEDWGGKYQSQDISAKQGLNVDKLLEKILLESEILDLKANPNRSAMGTVIEASLDKGRGYVTKMLVQNGTLKIGDTIVAGEHFGRVKAMYNERGKKTLRAGPAAPVLVLGLSGAPQAGEKFKVMENESEARTIASKRAQIIREQTTRATKRISLDEIGRRLALGNFKELNLIIKGDVDGSVEALADSLIKQSHETVQVKVIHKAVGQIIESDVLLASASDAVIIGFQVRPSPNARKLAEREGVEIKTYSIIYEAIAEIRAAIEGMLEPTKEEKIVGQIEVRDVFKNSKIGVIAGCYVQEGKFTRNTLIRVIRDGIVIFPVREGQQGELGSLKRFKDDVKEVKAGFECGLTINNFMDIQVGDTVEGYDIIEIKQKLAKL